MSKSPDAFRTISEVSEWLDTPTYVLRFWESRFPQIKPVKRAGGRRYYRPEDMLLLGGIKKLLHFDELTIKAAKTLLKDKGVKHVMDLSPDLNTPVVTPPSVADVVDKADIARMVKETPAEKPKPSVEVRVLKRVKQPKDDTKPIEEIAEEIAPAPEEMPVKSTQKDDLGKSDADQDVKAGGKSDVTPTDPPATQKAESPAPAAKADADADADADDKPKAPSTPSPVDQAKAAESERQAAAQKAADDKNTADEDAEDWSSLAPDMVMNVPYRIGIASDYDTETLNEIETLYYSLHMARNRMRRAIKQSAKQAG